MLLFLEGNIECSLVTPDVTNDMNEECVIDVDIKDGSNNSSNSHSIHSGYVNDDYNDDKNDIDNTNI